MPENHKDLTMQKIGIKLENLGSILSNMGCRAMLLVVYVPLSYATASRLSELQMCRRLLNY